MSQDPRARLGAMAEAAADANLERAWPTVPVTPKRPVVLVAGTVPSMRQWLGSRLPPCRRAAVHHERAEHVLVRFTGR